MLVGISAPTVLKYTYASDPDLLFRRLGKGSFCEMFNDEKAYRALSRNYSEYKHLASINL